LWRQKGYAAERSLCKKLERLGYCADRIPSSGPGKSNFPDIIATNKKRKISLALEVKSFYAKSVTIKKEQLIKAALYLIRHHYDYEPRKVEACVKFLMGERRKSPWICKLIPVRDDMDLDLWTSRWKILSDVMFKIHTFHIAKTLRALMFRIDFRLIYEESLTSPIKGFNVLN